MSDPARIVAASLQRAGDVGEAAGRFQRDIAIRAAGAKSVRLRE